MELDEAVDDVPCDDSELEAGDGDDEPSLGSHVLPSGAVSYSMPVGRGGELDCEGDEHDGREPDDNEGGDGALEDDEPNLGWTLNGQGGATSPEGDECEIGGSVGAVDQSHWVGSGGHDTGMAPAAMKAMRERYVHSESDRANADGKHIDTEGGYGGFKRLRNLSERQKKIVTPRLDRDAVHLT
jgi:hypothetical protein